MAANLSMVIAVRATMKSVRQDMKDSATAVVGLERNLKRIEPSFRGDLLTRKAHNVTAAVHRLGGASTLTAREQKRVNRTISEAVAKYRVLGKVAPDAMVKLA